MMDFDCTSFAWDAKGTGCTSEKSLAIAMSYDHIILYKVDRI